MYMSENQKVVMYIRIIIHYNFWFSFIYISDSLEQHDRVVSALAEGEGALGIGRLVSVGSQQVIEACTPSVSE